METYSDKKIIYVSFVLSVLLHGAIFIQFRAVSTNHSSQAQAPVHDTRISLNLLSPVKQKKQKVVDVNPLKPKKNAEKKIKKNKVIQSDHEQAIAPKIKKDVQRQQIENLIPIRQRYFSTLLTHIEGYKYYPRSARNRGIEGSIQVSFRLLANGGITGLIASGGPLILQRAAKSSVTDALPLPICPPEIRCPMQVSYSMQFKLN